MSRFLALTCIALMIAGLVVVAGCESGGFSDIDSDEPITAGTQTNFLDEVGNIVAFTQFGTFKLVIDDKLVTGNYKVVTSDGTNTIEMEFDDGAVETWSIVITEGKVVGVVDDEGTQYTQADRLEAQEVR